MEQRILALELPREIKNLISSLFYGIEGINWADEEGLYLPLLHIKLSDPSFDLDIMERLYSLNLEELTLKLNTLEHLVTKGKRATLQISLQEPEFLRKFQKILEKNLKAIPIKLFETPEDLHIPIGSFTLSAPHKLAEWVQNHHYFPSKNFIANRLILLKPVNSPKHKLFIESGRLDLKKGASS